MVQSLDLILKPNSFLTFGPNTQIGSINLEGYKLSNHIPVSIKFEGIDELLSNAEEYNAAKDISGTLYQPPADYS